MNINTNTVAAIRYETTSEGCLGGDSSDSYKIFIPSRHLSLSKDQAHRSGGPCDSKKAKEVANLYQRTHNRLTFDHAEYDKIVDQANKEAYQPVQVPQSAVDQIEVLLKEEEEFEEKLRQIREKIATTTKPLFES